MAATNQLEKMGAQLWGRGRGTRGRGRSRGSAGVLDFGMAQNEVEVPSAVSGESKPSMSVAEEIKKKRAVEKRAIARLSPKQRERLQQLQSQKEVGQFLMPDAPPSKKRRTASPDRVPCPLKPGTPPVPPPRLIPAWELDKIVADVSGPSRVRTPPCITQEQTLDKIDPSTNEEGDEIQPWERNASFGPSYPGSDEEEDDDFHQNNTKRHAGEYNLNDLPSELHDVVKDIDRLDDLALRRVTDRDMLTFDWSHDVNKFCGKRETFTGPSGPTFNSVGMSPFEIFRNFFDEDLVSLIVTETNRYSAMLCNDANLPQYARIKRWVPITAQDFFNFIAILMLQSLAPIPVESEYWAPRLPQLKLGNFPDIMPFYRFQLIKRCLHFVDNNLCTTGVPSKLTKIKPVLEYLNHKFSTLYLPGQDIAIDESLLLWKGRLSFAQLIVNKAAQVGIKSYELCESKTGYLWKMIVYTGKHRGHNVEDDKREQSEPEGATSQIVYSLVRPLLNKGHTLVMDNFYNSPLLARSLKKQKTDVMGTLRLHRDFVPISLKCKNKLNMREGEVVFSNTEDLTVTVWRDTNVVSLISTYHQTEVGGKEKYGYYKYRPTVVLDYNLTMGGVDKKDQLLQAFPIERCRNSTWYKKLFRRLLNVSIHNSFIIGQHNNRMPHRQFRALLVDEILKKFRPPKVPPMITENNSGRHFPAKNGSKRARCKWCSMKQVTSATVWKCDTCNVNLCILGCFKDYHLSLD